MISVSKDSWKKTYLAWIAVCAWIVIIFLFSNQPHSGAVTEAYLGEANVPIRKLAHMSEFAILFLLTRYAVSVSEFSCGWGRTRLSVASYMFCLGNALFDEWHQSLVPGRSATLSDAAVDMCGAMLAWVVVYFLAKTKK
ncbi:MAG: VanZ family protein [Candidatus Melainabacteria bacterium]|jgi:VanZ family protein|nr:VanZ family protein [Candidatus Melainabacteria bacterium]